MPQAMGTEDKVIILAIDPGQSKSAYVLYDAETKHISEHGIVGNMDMIEQLPRLRQMPEFATGEAVILVIEMVASYGMPVGASIFDTCVMIGRFIQAYPGEYTLMFRREVKLHLCNSARAKDGNVRQALIDRFPATGDGKIPQIGTKAQQGPLYGVRADIWQALGLAITYAERRA